MAVPCQSNDGLTQAEAECLLAKRSDILQSFGNAGWDTSKSNYLTIVCHWWNETAVGSATRQRNATLDAYLREQGCRGDGSGDDGGDDDGSSTGDKLKAYFDQAVAWAKANPVEAAIGAAVFGFLLMGNNRRRR